MVIVVSTVPSLAEASAKVSVSYEKVLASRKSIPKLVFEYPPTREAEPDVNAASRKVSSIFETSFILIAYD